MSASGGSCSTAAALAARALLEQGCTNLEAKIGAHVASYGGNCWQTDGKVREILRRPDGGQYHRESIGRARRLLARAGFIVSKRIMPNETPKGASLPSAHGTTSKGLRWSVLGLRCPTKRERRQESRAQRRDDQRRPGPRYSTPPAVLAPEPRQTKAPDVDPELAAQLAEFERLNAPRWERQSTTPDPRNSSHRPDPPE